jgi:hypothetical protein
MSPHSVWAIQVIVPGMTRTSVAAQSAVGDPLAL